MKKYAVIGLGKFGFHAAKALAADGNEVIAIDIDRAKVQAVDPFITEALVLNAMDKDALHSLGLEEMEAVVVSTGTNISFSIMICLHLGELGVKRILAKALDEDHEKILLRVGATEVVHPERDMALRISRALSRPNLLDFIPLSDDFDLVQLEPPPEFVGRSLKELNLRAKHNVHVIAIKRGGGNGSLLIPPADFVIGASDVLVMLGKTADLRKIRILV
jgi:trk system potassium uptake protein